MFPCCAQPCTFGVCGIYPRPLWKHGVACWIPFRYWDGLDSKSSIAEAVPFAEKNVRCCHVSFGAYSNSISDHFQRVPTSPLQAVHHGAEIHSWWHGYGPVQKDVWRKGHLTKYMFRKLVLLGPPSSSQLQGLIPPTRWPTRGELQCRPRACEAHLQYEPLLGSESGLKPAGADLKGW